MSDVVQGGSVAAGQGELERVPEAGAVPGGKAYRRLSEALTEEQQRALGLITMGVSIGDAGEQLGIHRGTIYRWMKGNPYFRAAYNAWQLEQQESCRAALVKAAEEAVARVIKSIPMDSNLAWRVIKELGFLSRVKPMSVKPSRVEMEIALEDHEEETVLLKRIEREVDDEEDLMSPRGDLARLLRLRAEAERGEVRRFEPPGAAHEEENLPAIALPSESVSRE